MKKITCNPDQLSFSLGRPLVVLLEEIQKTSRNSELRQAAVQMRDALNTLELASQKGLSKSTKTNQAIYEILTK